MDTMLVLMYFTHISNISIIIYCFLVSYINWFVNWWLAYISWIKRQLFLWSPIMIKHQLANYHLPMRIPKLDSCWLKWIIWWSLSGMGSHCPRKRGKSFLRNGELAGIVPSQNHSKPYRQNLTALVGIFIHFIIKMV